MTRQDDVRRARLAAALRDNLKRRKVQARAQAVSPAQVISPEQAVMLASPVLESGIQRAGIKRTGERLAERPPPRPPAPEQC